MPGDTTRRGYGWAYQKERATWARAVRTGGICCWRCGNWINPDLPWDLGHDDHDRSIIRGPEHVRCNRATSGRQTNKANKAKQKPQPPRKWSRQW